MKWHNLLWILNSQLIALIPFSHHPHSVIWTLVFNSLFFLQARRELDPGLCHCVYFNVLHLGNPNHLNYDVELVCDECAQCRTIWENFRNQNLVLKLFGLRFCLFPFCLSLPLSNQVSHGVSPARMCSRKSCSHTTCNLTMQEKQHGTWWGAEGGAAKSVWGGGLREREICRIFCSHSSSRTTETQTPLCWKKQREIEREEKWET